ncbi:MAG: radical SAM domain-containing protein, partial [Desulfobacteraceae bacterium]|nr:radical SAM domain-containing protein [Desulfobacteraceae bacterium]
LRSLENIACQLHQLKKLYGADIINYNAIFLGEHDALNAPKELIIFAAQKAYEILKLENGYMKGNKLFLFGSVDSLLEAEPMLFDHLEALPFYTFINVGLESNDPATLERIGKPITSQKVKTAFKKIQDINKRYASIEISTNFIMDDDLPDSHNKAFINLVREKVSRFQPKGTIYISPLKFNSPSREALYKFNEIKTKSLFPTFLYIIQRL